MYTYDGAEYYGSGFLHVSGGEMCGAAGVVVEFFRGIGLEAVVVDDAEEPMLVKNLARAYVEGA